MLNQSCLLADISLFPEQDNINKRQKEGSDGVQALSAERQQVKLL